MSEVQKFPGNINSKRKNRIKAIAPWEDKKGWSVLVQRLQALLGTL